MEEIMKLLQENEDSIIDSDESDSNNDTLNAFNLKKYIGDPLNVRAFNTAMTENNSIFKKRNVKERMPTRRPDPNVYNRNALLARENRRKKKIYLETIEEELRLARKANQALLKALKHQTKIRRQLEEEKIYFKGLFTKRSNNLVSDQASKSPSTSEAETNKSFSISSSFESLNFLNSEEGCEMSTCSSSVLIDETGLLCLGSTSNDLESEVTSLQTASLIEDDLWRNNDNVDYFVKRDSSIVQTDEVLRDVNNDHCYVTNLKKNEMPEENYRNDGCLGKSKTCSHHANADYLDIFCPICSIYPEGRTPPLQLLEDKL